MSKYIVLYATLIGVDFCEEGDIIELPDGTDRNFIARMQTIGAIAPYDGKEEKKDDKKPPEGDKDANARGLDENGNIND